jgi:hypothetical protein
LSAGIGQPESAKLGAAEMIEPVKKVFVGAIIVVVIIGFMIAVMGGLEFISDWI